MNLFYYFSLDVGLLNELKDYLKEVGDSKILHHWSHEQLPSSEVQELQMIPDFYDIIVIGTNSAALGVCQVDISLHPAPMTAIPCCA